MISNQIKFEKDWFENVPPSKNIGFFKILVSLGKIFDLPIGNNDPHANTFQEIFFCPNWPNGLGQWFSTQNAPRPVFSIYFFLRPTSGQFM